MLEQVPNPVYYWAGIASILAPLAVQGTAKTKAALFVGQCPPTFFILVVVLAIILVYHAVLHARRACCSR